MTEPEDIRRMLGCYARVDDETLHLAAAQGPGVVMVENDHVEASPRPWPRFAKGLIAAMLIAAAALAAVGVAMLGGGR